ncbi:hypothetical protein BGZ94_002686 [Podila epigama]|nr:hypothetical protein BGZ94_002686 [Podila epigama]
MDSDNQQHVARSPSHVSMTSPPTNANHTISKSDPNSDISSSTISTTTGTTKASGSGPIPITLDGYHQLQQKRALERQKEKERQRKHQKSSPSESTAHLPQQPQQPPSSSSLSSSEASKSSSSSASLAGTAAATTTPISNTTSAPVHPHDAAIRLQGNGTLAHQQQGKGHAGKSQSTGNEAQAGTSSNPAPSKVSSNVNSSHSNQHRKATTSQASRTTSPPTPVAGGSTSMPATHKSASGPRGPKAIHAIELIRIAGEILQFPPATIGTSLVYYHKYRAYLHQALKRGERDNEATKADEYLFATACLHLACKCTEVSRKVRDLVNVTYRVMNPNQPVLSLSTTTQPVAAQDNSTTLDSIPSTNPGLNPEQQQQQSQPQLTYPTAPPPTAQTYWLIRDSLLTTELMLLRILQFDLDVALPFSDVLRIYKGMGMVFTPTDEEAAQIYSNASNFDVFLPALDPASSHNSSSNLNNKHGPSSSSTTGSVASLSHSGSLAPHVGIHPTLSALVQISITFCIDALCSSTIALNSSSRALAMGSIYLAIRSAGLELPMPFEDWCYAWGRPMIATGFGISISGMTGSSSGSNGSYTGVYAMGPGGSIAGSSIGGTIGVGITGSTSMNTISGLATNTLFVSSPRPQQTSDNGIEYMEGVSTDATEMGLGATATANGHDPSYSQGLGESPLLSPAAPTSSTDGMVDSSGHQQQQPTTIVDEVRKVVQELGSFYTH